MFGNIVIASQIGWAMWDELGPKLEVEQVEIPAEFYLRFPGVATSRR